MDTSRDTPLNVTKTEPPHTSQENQVTPGDTSNSPTDRMSTDLVPQGLPDNQGGDEDDILLGEGVEQQDGDLSAEERIFLEEFPILKRELEVAIRRCHALADDIDRTHKTFTKTDLVTNSISAVSGMMTILGLALAPATAGASLALSTAGQGLGTVAMVTSIFTNISKHLHNKRAQAQASSQMPTPDQEIKEAMEKVVLTLNARKAVLDCGSKITDIKKNVRALQTARAHPQLATAAQRLLTSGRVSARRSRQVQRAFEGTTLVMKRNARLLGGVMAGLSLGTDMRALFKDWKRLQEGAKVELAEELRARAQELERKLSQLTQLYESLQQEKPLQEKVPRSSLSAEAMGTLPQPPDMRGATGA